MQTLSGAEAHLQELGFDLDKPLKRPWFGAEKKKAYDDYMAASTQVDDLRSKGGGSGTGTSSASRQKARRATRGGPGPTSKVVGQ